MVNTKRSARSKASRKRQKYRWHTKWSEISDAITECQKYTVASAIQECEKYSRNIPKPQKYKVKTKRSANSGASKNRRKRKRALKNGGPSRKPEVVQGGQTGVAQETPPQAYNEVVFHGIYFQGNDVFAREETDTLAQGFRRILHARTVEHVLSEQHATSQLQKVVGKILDKHRSSANQLLVISYSGHGAIKNGQLAIGSCKDSKIDVIWNAAQHKLQKYAGRNIVFFLDCCYAGATHLRALNTGGRTQKVVLFGAASKSEVAYAGWNSLNMRTARQLTAPEIPLPATTAELNDRLQQQNLPGVPTTIYHEFNNAPVDIRPSEQGLHRKIETLYSRIVSKCPPDHYVIAIVRWGREDGPLKCAERVLVCPADTTIAQIRKRCYQSLDKTIVGAQFVLSYGGVQTVRKQHVDGPKQLSHRCTVKRLLQMKKTFELIKGYSNDSLVVLNVYWTTEKGHQDGNELSRDAFCFCDGQSCIVDRKVFVTCHRCKTKRGRIMYCQGDDLDFHVGNNFRRGPKGSMMMTMRSQRRE